MRISHWDFHPAVRSGSDLTTGEKAADKLRHGMGSWRFVFLFLGIMAAWACLNFTIFRWDPYPFILLNLLLSTLAGLQGAVLLIAAKRADAISAALAAHHLEVSTDMNHLMKEMDAAVRDIHNFAKPKRCYDCQKGKHDQ